MIYGLRHRTTYSYSDSVSFARCVLRLTPRSSASQTVLESSIRVTPRPSMRQERTGAFGAQMVTVMVDRPHDTLVIDARNEKTYALSADAGTGTRHLYSNGLTNPTYHALEAMAVNAIESEEPAEFEDINIPLES